MDIQQALAKEFPALAPWQIENVEKLLDEGNTIPFIARYRKEQHGGLDDQVLRELAERGLCVLVITHDGEFLRESGTRAVSWLSEE